MNAEDFQDLYKLLRGSKSAFAVLDARTLFIERKYDQARLRIEEARESYSQSRSRLMKLPAEKQVDAKAPDAAKQIKRIERKQAKVTEILKAIDEMLPKLGKLIDRQTTKRVDEADSKSIKAPAPKSRVIADGQLDQIADADPGVVYQRPASSNDLPNEFVAKFNQLQGDRQLEWIGKHFGFRPVQSDADIFPDSLYFIKIDDETFLVQTRSADQMGDGVPLISVNHDVPMKTYTKEAFVRLGTRRRMVLLTTEFQMAKQPV